MNGIEQECVPCPCQQRRSSRETIMYFVQSSRPFYFRMAFLRPWVEFDDFLYAFQFLLNLNHIGKNINGREKRMAGIWPVLAVKCPPFQCLTSTFLNYARRSIFSISFRIKLYVGFYCEGAPPELCFIT